MVTERVQIGNCKRKIEDRGSILFPEKLRAKTILVLKFHHGLCDGYALIHIIDQHFGATSPYKVTDQKITTWNRVSNNTTFAKVYHQANSISVSML